MSENPQAASSGSLGASDDPSIPVLTDRILLPAVELDMSLPPLPETAAPTSESAAPEPASAAAPQPAAAVAEEPAALAGEASPPAEPAAEESGTVHIVGAMAADLDLVDTAGTPTAAGELFDTVEAPAEPAPQSMSAAIEAATAAALAAQAEELRMAVLHRVAERLPGQVDAAVRDLMQPAIDQAMARLGEEAQMALRISLQELVEQVLREELAGRGGPPPS